MQITGNHRLVLHKSWKVRLTLLSAALAGLSAVWEVFMGHLPTLVYVLGGVSLPLSVAAIQLIEDDDSGN